ncbi:MAG: Trehalose transport system permease protein SugA [Anaerolineae bacterium]|nr:Trehalose transport system permease protein SugA [Anaerolineae bacterium]
MANPKQTPFEVQHLTPSPSHPTPRRWFNLNDQRGLGLLLTLPAMLAIFGMVFIPFISSLILSLQRRDVGRPQLDGFVGLENYLKLLQDERFLNSLRVTLTFSLTSVIFELILGITIALVLNEQFKGRGFVRGLIILPWALPSIVNAAMWQWIYNADYGALNALLTQLGLTDQYQVWLANPHAAMALIILSNVWKETPFTVLLVLAALQGIPADIYDAAKVDGASAWQRFIFITLRLLTPVIMVVAFLQLLWGLQTFELAYIVTGGGPASSTELLSLRIYAQTFRSLRFGYGAAIAYLTGMLVLVPALFYIRAAYRSIVEY